MQKQSFVIKDGAVNTMDHQAQVDEVGHALDAAKKFDTRVVLGNEVTPMHFYNEVMRWSDMLGRMSRATEYAHRLLLTEKEKRKSAQESVRTIRNSMKEQMDAHTRTEHQLRMRIHELEQQVPRTSDTSEFDDVDFTNLFN